MKSIHSIRWIQRTIAFAVLIVGATSNSTLYGQSDAAIDFVLDREVRDEGDRKVQQ